MKLKGTKTEKNLAAAFAGESQARNKYTYYASKARQDGYEQIAAIFEETANNEREHAKMWFKALHGDAVPSTEENLNEAASGEHYEWTEMYKEFAEQAKEEGFEDIAKLFELVGGIEKAHEQRYQILLAKLKEGKIFASAEKQVWHCSNCGYSHEAAEAPEICPVCKHARKYFKILAVNY